MLVIKLFIEFFGEGLEELGVIKSIGNSDYQVKFGQEVLGIDPRYFRPTEVNSLKGDFSLARKELGWKPKIHIKSLIKDMVTHELKNLK